VKIQPLLGSGKVKSKTDSALLLIRHKLNITTVCAESAQVHVFIYISMSAMRRD